MTREQAITALREWVFIYAVILYAIAVGAWLIVNRKRIHSRVKK
jgi:hypothetical protein